MSEVQAHPAWARLGTELARLRELAGLNQRDIARALRVSQATVHRIEHGAAPADLAKVTAWAQACSLAGPDLERLRALTEAAVDEHVRYREYLTGGLDAPQRHAAEDEASAATIRSIQTWGIPALLQTADYARHVLAMSDYQQAGRIEDAVAARIARQRILYQEGRSFEFLVTEAALRWRPGPVAVTVAQLAHIAAVVTVPSIRFAVIPSAALAYAIPFCAVDLYEDRAEGDPPIAAVEIPHELAVASEPADIDLYRDMFTQLRRSALAGDDAVGFVRQIEQSLR